MFSERDSSIIIRKFYTENPTKKPHYAHTNDGHELYLLLNGDVSFSIDGQIYKLEPYDLLIISNKEIHRTIIHSDVPHERIYIYFDPQEIAKFNTQKYDLLQIFEARKLGFGNKIGRELIEKYDIPQYFQQIYEWSKSTLPEKNAMMLSILIQLIIKVSSAFTYPGEEEKVKEDVRYNGKIYLILSYISANLHKKITLEELEKSFFINKYYLCHLFKEMTGFTILEYITYKKISAAKELLKKTYAINEVCVKLGFEDYSNFYRSFKKVAGISPQQYVKNYIKK